MSTRYVLQGVSSFKSQWNVNGMDAVQFPQGQFSLAVMVLIYPR